MLRTSALRILGVGAAAVTVGSFAGFGLKKEQAAEAKFNPKEWQSYKLKETKFLTHNTKLFRFALDNPDDQMGMSTASCIVIRTPDPEDPSKEVVRPYTPTTREEDKGYFDLVIKEYPKGKASKYVFTLKPGDTLDVKGPYEKIKYTPNMKQHIGMVAGGTGITPMLQVIRTILENPKDKTKISLLFANQTPKDIILQDILDDYQKKHPDQLRVYYSVDKPNTLWKGLSGLPDKEKLQMVLPRPSDDNLILVCGPEAMVAAISGPKDKMQQGALAGMLKDMGYTEQQVFKF